MIIVWAYGEGDPGYFAYNWGIYNWIGSGAAVVAGLGNEQIMNLIRINAS